MNRLVYVGDIIERVKAYVLPSDLPVALKAFKDRTGMDAAVVEVSEKIFPILESVMPEGIELLPHGGASHYEIWLSNPRWDGKDVLVVPVPAVTIPDQRCSQNPVAVTSLKDSTHHRKNVTAKKKPVDFVPPVQKAMMKTRDDRIKELAGMGSCRQIREKMLAEGYQVSHMTINRRLRELLP